MCVLFVMKIGLYVFFMYRVMFLVLCYGFFLCVCLFVMKIVFFFFITFCLCPEHDIYE